MLGCAGCGSAGRRGRVGVVYFGLYRVVVSGVGVEWLVSGRF